MTWKKPLVVLTGPTAVGKTKLSIELAHAINGEIISADSMQVYKHMDIGSAKIRTEEMDGIPHHLIDILEPFDEFNIFMFKEMTTRLIDEICQRGAVPIIVGGTGFYIQAALYDIAFEDENDTGNLRKELEDLSREKGPMYMHEMLKEIDPESARDIHPNNQKRVIRAIEFYRQSGYPISQHNKEQRGHESPYNFVYFVLTSDRETIYSNIEKRVDIMIRDGLVDEVKTLKSMGLDRSYHSMQGLGYKEILDYLDGNISLEEAIYIIKRDTRHFAKRQLTWFRREKEVIWLDKSVLKTNDELMNVIQSTLKERNIYGKTNA